MLSRNSAAKKQTHHFVVVGDVFCGVPVGRHPELTVGVHGEEKLPVSAVGILYELCHRCGFRVTEREVSRPDVAAGIVTRANSCRKAKIRHLDP